MSIITLSDAKKVYDYTEVIGQRFSIPIPRDVEYTSLKDKNGYKNQTFSSNDMPEVIEAECFGITKYSADGKIHPVCFGTKNLVDNFCLQGKNGFLYGPDELNVICKVFGRQEGLIDIRSINEEDTSIINKEKLDDCKCWFPYRAVVDYSARAVFFVHIFDGDFIISKSLFYSNGEVRSYLCGVRPVFVLKSEIEIREDIP